MSPNPMVERIASFIEHLHREGHFDNAERQKNVSLTENLFHRNNFGPPGTGAIHLSVRLSALENAIRDSTQSATEDGERFARECERGCR